MVGGLNFLIQGMFGEKFRKLFQLVWCNNIHVCYWSGVSIYSPFLCANKVFVPCEMVSIIDQQNKTAS